MKSLVLTLNRWHKAAHLWTGSPSKKVRQDTRPYRSDDNLLIIMSIQPSDYEQLLARYSDCNEAIILLKQYRPYLEMIPSIRRSEESLITIPLPVVKLRKVSVGQQFNEFSPITSVSKTILIPCDLAYLMCDPEWKIKMGGEIVIFIQRPEEDLSDLLSRWRQTQVLLGNDYEWIMPQYYRHIISEGAEHLYPLFVLFPQTEERIKKGLAGAHLPCVIAQHHQTSVAELVLPDSSEGQLH